MLPFILKRLVISIPTIFIISIISFTVMQLPPGDLLTIFQARAAEAGATLDADIIRRFREIYRLDQPVHVQYFAWIEGIVLRGDFGYSILYRRPVADLVWQRIGNDIALISLSLLLAYSIGISIGIYSAVRKHSIYDHIFTFFGFLGMAIPNFFLALLLMYVAVVHLGVQSITGFFSNQYIGAPWSFDKFVDLLKHLWIPVLVIGTSRTAGIIRVMRANLLDVLGEKYITTARSKGLRERKVINKHAVRNAINPLITMMGMDLPEFVTGATIASIVLSLPTAGDLLYRALINQDMQMGASIILLLSVLLVLGNLAADLALASIDPRIRYE